MVDLLDHNGQAHASPLFVDADDLLAHITAAQIHMPGIRLERDGDVSHCQGMAFCSWSANKDGAKAGSGTTFFAFDAEGRIYSVTGFWS
jgi:hypothetical protein